jgi:hypothetical protein
VEYFKFKVNTKKGSIEVPFSVVQESPMMHGSFLQVPLGPENVSEAPCHLERRETWCGGEVNEILLGPKKNMNECPVMTFI